MARATEVGAGTYPTALASFHDELMELRAERAAAELRQRQLLSAMTAFRDGDFSVRLPADWDGLDGRIAENVQPGDRPQRAVPARSESAELERGQGRPPAPAHVAAGRDGAWWSITTDSLNTLIDDLVRPTTEIARTIGAVAKGDLGQSMELEVDGRTLKGEFLRSAKLGQLDDRAARRCSPPK
jgi:hypothetical protein